VFLSAQALGDEQVVEIVGVIAMFGFLNRWNDTLATPLEDEPLEFAEKHLTAGVVPASICVGSLPLAAGCVARKGARDSVRCSNRRRNAPLLHHA
jgi:hypothetical protein